MAGLGIRVGQHVGDLFGAMSDENVERVKRQNKRKISVVIGNPPYNANQANENDPYPPNVGTEQLDAIFPFLQQWIKLFLQLSRLASTCTQLSQH